MLDKSDDLNMDNNTDNNTDNLATADFTRVEEIDPTEEFTLATLELLKDSQLSVTLPVSAAMGYEVFCDVEQLPRWVSIVSSVQILESTPRGRVKRAAFMASLKGGALGYTLEYEYRNDERIVAWWTPDQPQMRVGGRAQFTPLGERACLMNYELFVDVPSGILNAWNDPYFDGHAPSAVLADFRDYLGSIAKKIQ